MIHFIPHRKHRTRILKAYQWMLKTYREKITSCENFRNTYIIFCEKSGDVLVVNVEVDKLTTGN